VSAFPPHDDPNAILGHSHIRGTGPDAGVVASDDVDRDGPGRRPFGPVEVVDVDIVASAILGRVREIAATEGVDRER
jgi:hypothetical protein